MAHPTKIISVQRLLSWLLMLLLSGLIPGAVSAADTLQQSNIKLEGTINTLPAQGLYGLWRIANHGVMVDERTQILDTVGAVAVGASVVVHGSPQPDGLIRANRIRITQRNRQDPDEIKVEAIVIEAPSSVDGIGEWRVRSHRDRTWVITVGADTEIDRPLPQVGEWVEIEGVALQGNKILARKLRVDGYEINQVVVRIYEGASIEPIVQRYHLSILRRLHKSAHVYLLASAEDESAEDLIARLRSDPDVIWAELNYMSSAPIAYPYQIWKWGGVDPQGYENQLAFAQIVLPPVQPFYKGDGVTVAILDTGISLTHPAFAGRLADGRDWVDDDDDPSEEGDGLAWGHGTHVAGIIAQIAPNSTLLPVRVLDANGRGDLFVVAAAIEWAVDQGADVINLSLGTEYNSEILRKVIEEASDAGVIVVAAAGNQGSSTTQYPAAYPMALAVTAVDEANYKADFANYNDWVDMAAPGVGITSTITGPEGDGYASWSGTSMATPFVSGVAALTRARDQNASSAAIRQQLIDNAADINAINPDYRNRMGGLLNATQTLGAPRSLYLPLLVR